VRVYKFGGASVKDAQGIRNLRDIVSRTTCDLVIVVSAMGKTTNALERVVNALWLRENEQAQREWQLIDEYHRSVCSALNIDVELNIPNSVVSMQSYDELYDQLVSCGELFSTRIVSAYLQQSGIDNTWLDATTLLLTDNTYRKARVDFAASEKNWKKALSGKRQQTRRVWVTQGFIGVTANGQRTTLGREGSDYSAAIIANLIGAEAVTIWKDVPGILTADPRKDKNAILTDELDYSDAERLAQSGAQIIHAKTIEPLEEKNIPLYVKPFLHPTARGSVIHRTDKRLTTTVSWGK
jgi:aspartate kinase